MAWIPKYKIEGGMYGGRWCPAGTLTGLIAICNVSISESVNCVKGLGGHNTTQSPYITWEGSYGMIDDLLKDYITSHDNDQYYEFLLAELPVENPEGAQFYKQTLTIYCRIKARLEHEESGDDSVDYWYYEVGITKICRREYPTPYSAWTEDVINDLDASMNGTYYKTGKKEIGGFWTYYTTGMKIAISPFSYHNTDYFGIGIYQETERADTDEIHGNQEFILGIKESRLNEVFDVEFDPDKQDDPNEDPDPDGDEGEGGESGEGGGDGDHNKRQDPVPYPDDPPIGGAGAGFITLYRMSRANMARFAKKMFEADVMKALKDFFADPLDMICGIMIVPFSPETSGHAKPVVHMVSPLPDIEWDMFYPVITDQYQDIDCGTIDIGSFYDSCFSYNPYTRYMIWLPYIGYRDLDPDEVTGHTIHVKYKVDCMTGDCVAFIMTTSISMPGMVPVTQCIAQYSGNCGVRVAFGRQSFDSAIQASIQLATGLVGGAVRGAGSAISAFVAGQAGGGSNMESDTLAEGQMAQAAGSASSGISMPSVAAMKTHVIKSGVSGSNAGYISVQTPHVIMFVPRQSRPENYRHIKGYPANLAGPISDGFLGYLEIENIQLDGITATSPEKAEIAAILRGGVLYGNA